MSSASSSPSSSSLYDPHSQISSPPLSSISHNGNGNGNMKTLHGHSSLNGNGHLSSSSSSTAYQRSPSHSAYSSSPSPPSSSVLSLDIDSIDFENSPSYLSSLPFYTRAYFYCRDEIFQLSYDGVDDHYRVQTRRIVLLQILNSCIYGLLIHLFSIHLLVSHAVLYALLSLSIYTILIFFIGIISSSRIDSTEIYHLRIHFRGLKIYKIISAFHPAHAAAFIGALYCFYSYESIVENSQSGTSPSSSPSSSDNGASVSVILLLLLNSLLGSVLQICSYHYSRHLIDLLGILIENEKLKQANEEENGNNGKGGGDGQDAMILNENSSDIWGENGDAQASRKLNSIIYDTLNQTTDSDLDLEEI